MLEMIQLTDTMCDLDMDVTHIYDQVYSNTDTNTNDNTTNTNTDTNTDTNTQTNTDTNTHHNDSNYKKNGYDTIAINIDSDIANTINNDISSVLVH